MTNSFEGLNGIPITSDLRKDPQEQDQYQPPGVTQSTLEAENEETQKFNFKGLDAKSYEPPKPRSKFDKAQDIVGRGAGRTVARVYETLGGFARDTQDFIMDTVTTGVGTLVGHDKAEEASQNARSIMEIFPFTNLPGREDIREKATQVLTGDLLEPQNDYEELYDNMVSDLALLFTPGGGFKRALATSVFGNLGSEAIKQLGGGEGTQAGTKMGIMFFSGLFGREGAKNHVRNLQNEARSMIPQDAFINGNNMLKILEQQELQLRKGGVSPQKQPSLALNRQLQARIRQGNGQVAVHELPEYRKSINDYRFNKELNPTAHYWLDRLDDVVDGEINQWGSNNNQAFLNRYRDANIGTVGIKQSDKLLKFIPSKFDTSKLSPETLILLGLHTPGTTIAAGGGLIATAKSARLIHRITRNPVLRKYYANVVKYSLAENAPSMIRSLKGLNKEIEKGEY